MRDDSDAPTVKADDAATGRRVATSGRGAAGSGRRVAATFRRYGDAQRAVDHLADRGFPVERVAIVAEGIRIVEQVTGRLTYARAAVDGAVSGAFVGAFFGALAGLLEWTASTTTPLLLVLSGLVLGALLGGTASVVLYLFTGGQRDFSSVGGLEAERYDLLVDDEVTNEAEALLEAMGTPDRPAAS